MMMTEGKKYLCSMCTFAARTYNELVEHGQKQHGEKVIDPGNEFSSPSAKKLANIIAWLRHQPDANLSTGEGKLLLDEIDRLTQELAVAKENLNQVLKRWTDRDL